MIARVAVPALDHQRDAFQNARGVLELVRESFSDRRERTRVVSSTTLNGLVR